MSVFYSVFFQVFSTESTALETSQIFIRFPQVLMPPTCRLGFTENKYLVETTKDVCLDLSLFQKHYHASQRRRKDFSQGKAMVDFFWGNRKGFFQGGPKVVKFHFMHSKLKKQTFC